MVGIIVTVTAAKLDVLTSVWHDHYGGLYASFGSQGSAVGTATRYGLDRLGIESWWGKIFCTYPLAPRPTSLLYNGYRVFPRVKRLEHGADHPLHSSTKVANGWKLYLCLRSVPAEACHGMTFYMPIFGFVLSLNKRVVI